MQEKSRNEAPLSAKRADKSGKQFPIVGIGASAGGLDAFTKLFEQLPSDTGMAFVLIQHLAPTHESVLSELLSRVTPMPVSEVEDDMEVEPNHVYVIPPNMNMSISRGILKLITREKTRGLYLPIDYFFRSLAENIDGISIGVVLSGTGSDGSEGIKAIKAQGGITFAQDPESAEQGGMPRSAIATGAVDFIMMPQEIAQELARIAKLPYIRQPKATEIGKQLPESEDKLLNRIFALLRETTGVDFTYYKHGTIKRRIARRMALLRIETLQDYVKHLQENPVEVQDLYQDILIKVTEFFRDPEAFEALKREVFPKATKGKSPETPIRVWVPGCSTGEEAYSLAISLFEFLGDTVNKPPIQVFATDINEADLDIARASIYPESIRQEVSLERLQRFFEKVEGGYRVINLIRDMCVFAKHDVTKDPPFSKLELISFRNVLIYMQPTLQNRLIPMFHYALNPGGFLILGLSETIAGFTDLFAVVDKKYKIYSRKPVVAKLPVGFAGPAFRPEKVGGVPSEVEHVEYDPLKEANQIILESYAPAGFLINSNMEILQFYGNTGPYLKPSIGKASLNLLKMIQKGLTPVLRSAINEAKKTNAPVSRAGLSITYNNQQKIVDFDVVPMKDPSGEFYFVVLFKDVCPIMRSLEEAPPSTIKAGAKRSPKDVEIAQLRRELVEAEDHLQSVIKEKDIAYEELQATSEELQSSNEELQSINEELETSKEELQSTNEELATVNQELENRNVELAQSLTQAEDARDYAEGIVATVREPLVVLNQNLRVNSANRSFFETFKVAPEETKGKLIYDLGNRQWDIPRLRELLEKVIPESSQFEGFEVEYVFPAIGYKTMLLNARKIHQEAREPLILLAIEDITERKQAEELSGALNEINAAISSTLNFEQIISRVAEKSAKAIKSESDAIILREGDFWVIKYTYGFPQELAGTKFTDDEVKHLVLVANSKKPLVVNDAYMDERVDPELMKKLGIRSFTAVPLLVRDRVIGILSFHYRSAPVSFTEAQVDFANKLATSISLALENARLYEAEKNIANILQEALQVMPEKVPGIEFGYLYRSATEAAWVGGDFYDLFELENDRVGIIIGDVSGKGIGAAALTAIVKNTIKAYALERYTPALVMSKTNDAVKEATGPSLFITVFFGILDTNSGALTYCSAGHPPAIIKRETQKADLLATASPLIGAFPDLRYIDSEARLGRADTLILYTDGVIEARCDGGLFGEERLVSFIKELQPVSAKLLPQQIFNEVMVCTGGKLSDDVALLAISLK